MVEPRAVNAVTASVESKMEPEATEVVAEPATTDPAPVKSKRSRLYSFLALALQIGCVLYIGKVLFEQRAELARAFELDWTALTALLLLSAVTHVQRTYEFTYMLRRLGVHEPFRDGFWLTGAGFLLNQLPFNAGLVMRASVLKRDHSLSYTSYLALVLVNALMNVTVAAILGIVVVLLTPMSQGALVGLSVLFGAIVAGAALVFWLPAGWIPSGENFVVRKLRTLTTGISLIRRGRAIALLFVLAISKVVVAAVRMWICFGALGVDIAPLAAALLASITVLSTLFNITPGNMGLRELALAGLSTHLSASYSVGMAAASIDRVVLLVYTVVTGLPGLYKLRKRGPFKS